MNTSTIETVVAEHTVTLSFIVGTMTEVKDTLKEISQTQRKMEVLMERQSNHEEQTRASFVHIHGRMDAHEEEDKQRLKSELEEKKRQEAYCKMVESNAINGNKAYRALVWFLGCIGVLAIGTFYSKIWGAS